MKHSYFSKIDSELVSSAVFSFVGRALLVGLCLQLLSACYTPATQVILPKCLNSPGDSVYVSHDWDVPFRKTKVDLEDAGEVTLVSSVPSPSRLLVGGLMFGLAGLAGWGYTEDGVIDTEEAVLMVGLATAGTVVAVTGWHPSEGLVDLSQESCSASSYQNDFQTRDSEGFNQSPDDYGDDEDYAPPPALEPQDEYRDENP